MHPVVFMAVSGSLMIAACGSLCAAELDLDPGSAPAVRRDRAFDSHVRAFLVRGSTRLGMPPELAEHGARCLQQAATAYIVEQLHKLDTPERDAPRPTSGNEARLRAELAPGVV